MKISFIFFRALFYLICIYKVQTNFWSCLNRLEKGFNHPGHVARSEGVPKGSLGVGFGTRGTLRRSSEGVSRCGLRDTWHAPKEFRRGLSVWASGHVACSEGVPKGSLGVGFGTRGMLRRSSEGVSRCGLRDTWHAPKEFRRGLSVWASGHVAYSEGVPKGSLGVGVGTRGMLRRSSEGVSRFGHSGHVA